MKKGLLFIVTGPSGVGKKTILDKIITKKELNLTYSVSVTTRIPRTGETNGADYYFVSDEEFCQRVANDEFLEWAEFAGNKYGTLKSEVIKHINNGKNVLLEIEVQGGHNIITKFNKDEYCSIFITPPSIEELKNRLIKRGTESLEKINQRIEKATSELSYSTIYDEVVLNDDADNCAQKVEAIIKEHIHE
ncbi:MAG: guanylate kinase [Mycoplasmoidaceae bacterium]